MSVSIKTEKMVESKHAEAKKGKISITPEKSPEVVDKNPTVNRRDGDINMSTEEAPEQPTPNKMG